MPPGRHSLERERERLRLSTQSGSQETPADPGCLSRRAGPASVSPPSLPDHGSSKGPGASSRVPTNGCSVMMVACAHWVLTRTGPSAKNFTWIQPHIESHSPQSPLLLD